MKSLEAKLLNITPTKDVGMAGSVALRWKVRGKRPTNLYSILDLINSSVPSVRHRFQSCVKLSEEPSLHKHIWSNKGVIQDLGEKVTPWWSGALTESLGQVCLSLRHSVEYHKLGGMDLNDRNYLMISPTSLLLCSGKWSKPAYWQDACTHPPFSRLQSSSNG